MNKVFLLNLLLLFVLNTLCCAQSPISITDSGNNILYQSGNINRLLPKSKVSTRYSSPYLELLYKTETIFSISANTQVTSPSSTSLLDLQSKIITILSAQTISSIDTATSSEVASATNVDFWGDSFTAGDGGASYPSQFATLTRLNVVNDGIGGQNSTQIKARFDAAPARYPYAQVIWEGRNDITQGASSTTIKANIAAMISALGHNRYLVIGILPYASEINGTTNANIINTLNSDLATLYGTRFIDIKAYLLTQGTGTGQDAIDVANGITPTSLRSDPLHLNTLGYSKVASQVNLKLGILVGEFANLLITAGTLPKALPNGQIEHDVAIGGSYKIGGTSVAFLPDQVPFQSSLFLGNGGRFLSHASGSSEGTSNTTVGIGAGYNISTANINTFIGTFAGYSTTSGSRNTYIGVTAGQNNITGTDNTAIGSGTMINATASGNTAVGQNAGGQLSSGATNAFFGQNAGQAVQTGANNTAIGASSMAQANGASSGNVVIGREALLGFGAKNNNTVAGYQAANSATTASNSIFIGYRAGTNITTGNNNIAIGYNINVPSATASNQLNIGNILFGTGISGTGTTVAGKIGIGVSSPAASSILDVTSTTAGFLVPRMTTTQRDAIASPAEGLEIYNLTTHTKDFYNGTVWKTITTN